MDTQDEWIPVSQAAEMLGCSTHTVYRKAKAGQLEATSASSTAYAAPRSRGRRPRLLVSAQAVSELRVREGLDGTSGAQVDDGCREKLVEAEAERVRLLAEIERLKEVIRLSLVRDDLQAQADAARRDQLSQFIIPDFPND